MARQILHIDLDAFFVAVEQALDPTLKGKPVVVGGQPRGRGVVACASYEARAYGLRSGMPLTTAYRLCPQAVFLPGRFSHYQQASEKFMAILADFTPGIEPCGIDEAYLDITGFEPLYGPPLQTAMAIKQRIRSELSITASVGIASCKVVAKVASDLCKPDGILEVKPGEERSFLAPLAVAKLPCVGPKTEQALRRLGVTTIGQLAALPDYFVRIAFGAAGEVILSYARGIDTRKLELPGPPKSISRATTFAEDTLDRSLLKATLAYLSERVGAELRKQRRRAKCVILKLRYADFSAITRHFTLTQACNSDEAIFGASWELLTNALRRSRQRVRLIGVGMAKLVGPERQMNMLDSSGERLECLNQAVDMIRHKHEFAVIQRGRTLCLGKVFSADNRGYVLKTPSLSR